MNAVLIALRNRLSVDAELVAFFNAHYGKTLKHLFGYKKALKVDDYPILSYVCTKGTYPGRKPLSDDFVISLVLGVNDDRLLDANNAVITDELSGDAQFLAFSGAVNSSAVVEMIIKSLQDNMVVGEFFVASEFVVFTEVPPNSPFFNTEITFILKRGR